MDPKPHFALSGFPEKAPEGLPSLAPHILPSSASRGPSAPQPPLLKARGRAFEVGALWSDPSYGALLLGGGDGGSGEGAQRTATKCPRCS